MSAFKSSNQAFKFCFFFKRIFKLKVSEPPEDIKKLFQEYSENGTMTVEDLHRFLENVQNEDSATTEYAQAIFNSLKHLFIFQRRGLHVDAFFRYLLGDLNFPISTMVHQDMTAPLAHYFLYTGHNSYLTGNQLSSDSSVEPIIQALRRGVRVIELDLWPNSKKNDVKVSHGGTLTSPVDLIKCLRAIKDNAFVASEYPVVITFEDHLTPNLQAKVAQMVTKVFGDMLYQTGHLEEFPSPESMKRKILISTKPPEEGLNSSSKIEKSYSKIESDDNDKDQLDGGEFVEYVDEEKAAPEYRKLIAIHAMKLRGGLEKILRNIDPYQVSRLSMSEQQLENAVNNNLGADIVRFTQRNLLRVYPKGTRITSSNYNPFVGWEHGAQMVAFNMQGIGKHLRIMQGMFRANGGCGYVKKPDFLLVKHPFDQSEVKTILKVAIAGVEADIKKEITKTISDQWVPEWNEEFEFPLSVPELALLRIEVFDYDDTRKHDFAGQTCLPVSELRSGIRAVPLHNRHGDQYKYTRLLVRFEFE
ncbi:hypothetical protein JRO89_XS13G0099000 [Xanthoceras sorbifolium]|uniref:Phosphoinositide phospholipase C n=1 Tax=Xanthoceras sorbifolium TaxID=99658 RepID=A0ABQ8H7J2_9ROSI|nr:hypothetical protein JRO89_XS13G0099000 [Xanthoceras sorbifolium]